MSKQREALQMALEMIESHKHERRHVRWAIKDALASKSSIAQAIRDAAVNGVRVSQVEHWICLAFVRGADTWVFQSYNPYSFQSRTFMLFVAEALES
jgi:hypothetical protein